MNSSRMDKYWQVNLYNQQSNTVFSEWIEKVFISVSVQSLEINSKIRSSHLFLMVILSTYLIKKFFFLCLSLLLLLRLLLRDLFNLWSFFSLYSLNLNITSFIFESLNFFHHFINKSFTLFGNSNFMFFKQIVCYNLSHKLENIGISLCSGYNSWIHDNINNFTCISVFY